MKFSRREVSRISRNSPGEIFPTGSFPDFPKLFDVSFTPYNFFYTICNAYAHTFPGINVTQCYKTYINIQNSMYNVNVNIVYDNVSRITKLYNVSIYMVVLSFLCGSTYMIFTYLTERCIAPLVVHFTTTTTCIPLVTARWVFNIP